MARAAAREDGSASGPVSQKERTRARIIEEAARAMRENGTQGIGVAALMKRLGLTHGGFYAHFEDRDDLVAHAVQKMYDGSKSMVARHLTGPDARLGLASFIDAYLSPEKLETIGTSCPMPPLMGEAPRLPKAAQAEFAGGMETFRKSLTGAVERAGYEDAEALAGSIMAELVGALSIARAIPDRDAALAVLETSRRSIRTRLGLGHDA